MKIPFKPENQTAYANLPGIALVVDDGQARFIIPGRSEVIPAVIVGDELDLQPARSSSHRALASALGYE